MQVRAPDPTKLLEAWMEWERGETMPGRVMSNLKTAGLRDLLEALVAEKPAVPDVDPVADAPSDQEAAAVWTPIV